MVGKRKIPKPNSPGIAAGPVTKVCIPVPKKRRYGKASLYTPSHKQMARLCTRLVPPDLSTTILNHFDKINEDLMSKKIPHPTKYDDSKCVGKTPICWIEEALCSAGLSCTITSTRCDSLKEPTYYGYIARCVLTRHWKQPRQDMSSQFSETVLKQQLPMDEYKKEQVQAKFGDDRWYEWILVLPHSGCFYVLSNVCSQGPGLSSLPVSWLRLCKFTGQPAKDAFVSVFKEMWVVDAHSCPPRKVLRGHHFDDYEDSMPLLAPDFMFGEQYYSQAHARTKFRESIGTAIKETVSFRSNCRRYLRGSYHKTIPESCYIFDHHQHGDTSFELTCRNNDNSPREISIVQVCDVRSSYKLMSLLHDGSCRVRTVGGNCRQHNEDGGRMYGVGDMVCSHLGKTMHTTKITEHIANGNLLSCICRSARNALFPLLYSVIPTMMWREKECCRTNSENMGGESGITASMNLSNGLHNATHYDVNDGSVGCSVWTELVSGDSKNWYFVIPNVLIKVDGITYHGLCIKLHKGTAIAWDGRIIRHGTSKTESSTGNSTFGWFWSADIVAMKQCMATSKNIYKE